MDFSTPQLPAQELLNPAQAIPKTSNEPTTQASKNQQVVDTFKRLMDEMNSIKLQLDNTELLKREKCRCLAGYYDDDNFFQLDKSRVALMNVDGWNRCEAYLDKNTNVNAVTSILKPDELRNLGRIEAITFAKDIMRNYKTYGISLENIEGIVIDIIAACYKGIKRAVDGQTLKMINKVIKQIEQRIMDDRGGEKRKGWFK